MMRTMLQRHLSDGSTRDEAGSVTPFIAALTLTLFIVIGLVVDGGGKLHAMQRADAVAHEAARAGGQAIQTGIAVQGDGAVTDAVAARQAAQSYLAAAGVQGTVTIIGGNRLRVTTTETYDPKMLGLIGIGSMSEHGEAEVRLVTGIGSQEVG